MNVVLNIFNILGGIAALFFFYDRFGHLLPSRKSAKRKTYNLFDDPYSARQEKSVRLKHIRLEASGLAAGIVLGVSGVIFGHPGYLIVGPFLGIASIAFCYWREDREARDASVKAVNEFFAIAGFVLLFGSVCSVWLGLSLGGLLGVDEKSYPGSLVSILTLITTASGGFAFGYLMRDL
jgi:hypothetical protein